MVEEPALDRLYAWVRENGGIVNCESRQDAVTGLRGLYASEDLGENTTVIQIPNKLIVSPYHISKRNIAEWEGGELKYEALFESAP